MRAFYIFKIKDEFKYLYKNNESTLYNILKQIYYLPSEEIGYAKTLLNQLVNDIDKEYIDRDLFIKLHQKMPYSKRGEIHYMNNLYKDEISKLIVKNKYIKIETETNFSSFFEILSNYDNNFFVCDFDYLDFFFIDSIKVLV